MVIKIYLVNFKYKSKSLMECYFIISTRASTTLNIINSLLHKAIALHINDVI